MCRQMLCKSITACGSSCNHCAQFSIIISVIILKVNSATANFWKNFYHNTHVESRWSVLSLVVNTRESCFSAMSDTGTLAPEVFSQNTVIWNKPCLRFDKAAETDLWSHKQATSFPCQKSVQSLNWVADWLLSRPLGINAVTVNLIGCTEKLHRMRLKTGCNCDVDYKQYW